VLVDFYMAFEAVFQQYFDNIFQHFMTTEVIWRTPIRTKWHQLKLPSLYLAKVMAISNYEIWVLQNFSSKNFKISKFWICHFLTIAEKRILLEHINSLNSSLLMILMLSVKSVFFQQKKNWCWIVKKLFGWNSTRKCDYNNSFWLKFKIYQLGVATINKSFAMFQFFRQMALTPGKIFSSTSITQQFFSSL
jgi:hypothetical protein